MGRLNVLTDPALRLRFSEAVDDDKAGERAIKAARTNFGSGSDRCWPGAFTAGASTDGAPGVLARGAVRSAAQL